MGIFGFLAGRIGLPLVLIAGAGALIFAFRTQLVAGASGLGSTVGQVITTPFTSFFESVRNAFANLGDININIPGINITGGGFNFDLFNTGGETVVNPNPFPFGDGTAQFPPGCTVDNNGIISCPTPPIFTPGDTEVGGSPTPSQELTIFQGGSFRTAVTLPSGFAGIRTRAEIIEQFPGVIGLFDVLGTSNVEFLPLTLEQVLSQQGDLRLSSQLFEEVSSLQEAIGLA